MTFTPYKETETQAGPAETSPAGRKPSRPGRGRLLFGLAAALLLGGLLALALLSARDTALPGPGQTPATTAGLRPALTPAANSTPLPDPFVARPVVHDLLAGPADFQSLWAALNDGLRRSTDGGRTWSEVADFRGRAVTGLAFDPDDPERPVYAATAGAGVFKSADGGRTWKNIGLAGRPVTRLAAARRTLYAAVAGPRANVYFSPDGGQSWQAPARSTLPPDLDVRALAVDAANPQNVFIGTAPVEGALTPDWGRVKASYDGGRTWRDLGLWGPPRPAGAAESETERRPDPLRPVITLLYAPGDRLYAGDGETLWRLTPDRSAFQPVEGGLPTGGVYALTLDRQLPGLVYAATRDGFYRNTDGVSWQKMATGESGPFFAPGLFKETVTFRPALAAATTSSAANSLSGLRSTQLYALSADGRLTRYENRDFGSEAVAEVPGATNLPNFARYGGVNPADPLPPPAEGQADPNKLYVRETGHYIQGAFKEVWQRKDIDVLQIYGYPLTEQFVEFDPGSKKERTVQFFERVKFVLSDPGDPIQVRLSLLGHEAIEGRYFPPGRFLETNERQQYFPQTQHTLKGAFFDFWKKNGELARYGYPISEEFVEKNEAGKETIYQYFERAKFAFDPETKKVTVALLGREVLQKRGWLK